MNKITLSCFSDEYATPFEEQLKGVSALGFGYIELRFIDGKNVSTLTDEELEYTKALLDKYSVKVSAIGSPLGKVKLDDDLDAHMELCRRVCYIANYFGARFIRMFSFYAAEGKKISEQREEVLSALAKMLDIADEYSVTLCHENEAEIYGESPDACLELLEYFGGRLGCVFDTGNFALGGFDTLKAYESLSQYVKYMHIKDGCASGAIVPPGEGEGHIAEILKKHTDKYGPVTISLEPHLDVFDGLNSIAAKSFDNPFVYASPSEAFTDAAKRLHAIVEKI
jgi:sugar phosphate isomerase/epimerase